jgi:hypothetical protein
MLTGKARVLPRNGMAVAQEVLEGDRMVVVHVGRPVD